MARIQRRLFEAQLALRYFMMRKFNFENDNFYSLNELIHPNDVDSFRFDKFLNCDAKSYLESCMLGARRYLLKEKDENIPKARRNFQR